MTTKRYIFLTSTIRNVGGAQLYMSRKMDWLKSLGWLVDTYYYNDGNVVIENLKEFKNHCIPELSIPFELLVDRKKKKILKTICSVNSDVLIIESHILNLCLWGEYIISQKGGMNLCYLLSETFPPITKSTRCFLEYKLQQNLLFGINDRSIPLLLGNSSQTSKRGLLAVGNNEDNVKDIEDYEIPLSFDNKVTIISLGRLDKPYIEPMVNSIKYFVSKHKELFFNVIFIGDAAQKEIKENILGQIDKEPNVETICTGYMLPIPRKLLKAADVAIASSGCVRITRNEGILTIAIDGEDYMALGIAGITTNNSLYRNNCEPKQKVEDLLEDILINKKYKKEEIVINSVSTVVDYSKHKAIIDGYKSRNAYNMESGSLSIKQMILKYSSLIIGYKNLNKLYSCYLNIFR